MSVRGTGRRSAGAPDLTAAAGRDVSAGSVFSTILITHVVRAQASHVATGGQVVDVGCGEGPFRDLLAPDSYVGLDRRPRVASGDRAVVADVAAIPLRAASFDAAMCTEVIEHVPDERRLAAELARVVRPGGALILSSPFVHRLHEMPHDHRRLTSIGLVRVLEGAGWEVERMVPIGASMVVSVDSAVRWLTGRTRAIGRRVGRGSLVDRVLGRANRALQRRAAAVALARTVARAGPIDPFDSVPPLTLGYVVVARRRSDPAALAARDR